MQKFVCLRESKCTGTSETGMAVCVYFSNNQMNNRCEKGDLCPYRLSLCWKFSCCTMYLTHSLRNISHPSKASSVSVALLLVVVWDI